MDQNNKLINNIPKKAFLWNIKFYGKKSKKKFSLDFSSDPELDPAPLFKKLIHNTDKKVYCDQKMTSGRDLVITLFMFKY